MVLTRWRKLLKQRKVGNLVRTTQQRRTSPELTEIKDCLQVTMPSSQSLREISRLLYTKNRDGLLALGTNGIQKLWKWSSNEQNPSGQATAKVYAPSEWSPDGLQMVNDVPDNLERVVPCMDFSADGAYLISAYGGTVKQFNTETLKEMATHIQPPPASTFLLFNLGVDNVIAVGMADSTIVVYHIRNNELWKTLKGHKRHITGLAFSDKLNILVSSGADAQIRLWACDSWSMKLLSVIHLSRGRPHEGETQIQFHNEEFRLLVTHETQLAICDASKRKWICEWVPKEVLSSPIISASYSSDDKWVYASFTDGNIGVFDVESLGPKYRIAPSAYIPQPTPDAALIIPRVIATHPQSPYQFAIGLSDGSIKVIEILQA